MYVVIMFIGSCLLLNVRLLLVETAGRDGILSFDECYVYFVSPVNIPRFGSTKIISSSWVCVFVCVDAGGRTQTED